MQRITKLAALVVLLTTAITLTAFQPASAHGGHPYSVFALTSLTYEYLGWNWNANAHEYRIYCDYFASSSDDALLIATLYCAGGQDRRYARNVLNYEWPLTLFLAPSECVTVQSIIDVTADFDNVNATDRDWDYDSERICAPNWSGV